MQMLKKKSRHTTEFKNESQSFCTLTKLSAMSLTLIFIDSNVAGYKARSLLQIGRSTESFWVRRENLLVAEVYE